jgi:hypothetical protein
METLGKHFQTLSKAAFQRYGFGQTDLVSRWAAIAGDDVAALCKPDKIKWPRRTHADEKGGGTLVLRAEPGRSLDIQYQIPKLLNRINQFFGYQAVVAIKVIQGTKTSTVAEPLPPPPIATVLPLLSAIEDGELKLALARLGANIAASSPSPQTKTETK